MKLQAVIRFLGKAVATVTTGAGRGRKGAVVMVDGLGGIGVELNEAGLVGNVTAARENRLKIMNRFACFGPVGRAVCSCFQDA